MEIPGLSRLRSPETAMDLPLISDATMKDSTETNDHAPKKLSIEERIALMRQEIKAKEGRAPAPMGAEKAEVIDPDAQRSMPEAIIQPITSHDLPAAPSSRVNYSILDEMLATHGFESVEDSGEELQYASSSEMSTSESSEDQSDSDDESDAQSTTQVERSQITKLLDEEEDGDAAAIPRTKNEVLEDEEPIQVPDFVIGPDEAIQMLGTITNIVNTTCVVTGAPSPTTRVLDIGSLLVFEDRSNLGFIADTFGPIILPMFSVRFKTLEDLQAAGVRTGRDVYVVPRYAQYVFSETLKIKGTDASNVHDEEQSEVEFSDDEQEARYKAQKKQARRDARMPNSVAGTNYPIRPLNDLEAIALSQGLSFDPSQNSVRRISDGENSIQNVSGSKRGQSRRGRGNRGRIQHSARGQESMRAGSRDTPQEDGRPDREFTRAFYQEPRSGQADAEGQITTGPVPAEHVDSPIGMTLYRPLQRPS